MDKLIIESIKYIIWCGLFLLWLLLFELDGSWGIPLGFWLSFTGYELFLKKIK